MWYLFVTFHKTHFVIYLILNETFRNIVYLNLFQIEKSDKKKII